MFRLVVNAGSLQENDAQRGLAHFLGHMAFKGTEKFEKQDVAETVKIDVSSWTKGVYFLEVVIENKVTFERFTKY